MSIERQTVIDQIEITRQGTVQVRFGLLLVEDGKEIDCRWHRTVLDENCDIDGTLTAVNGHLLLMGCKPVADADISRVKQFISLNADIKAAVVQT